MPTVVERKAAIMNSSKPTIAHNILCLVDIRQGISFKIMLNAGMDSKQII